MEKSQLPEYTPADVYQPDEQAGTQLYPPMPQPQAQPQQPQQPTLIINSGGQGELVGIGPTRLVCRSCHAEIITSVKRTANFKTHAFAVIFCLFGCWPCVCIPYCMDSCRTANHYCPNCNAFIGQHEN